MEHDDQPVGRLLNRRDVLTLLGLTGSAALLGRTTGQTTASENLPSCIVSPEMTEGPYFVDEQLLRSDIRTDTSNAQLSEGARLDLNLKVLRVSSDGCGPLPNTWVDIWHCDAYGRYSDVIDRGSSTRGSTYLRGSQISDDHGLVRFTTIYPGWYPGRAVHIHFKLRSTSASEEIYEFTSQFFFDDAFTDVVYQAEPYAAQGARNTLNSSDGIYRNGGNQLILPVTTTATGYEASFDIGMQKV
jgi:protocatechuate 3,4-dioxygenase beta subunit